MRRLLIVLVVLMLAPGVAYAGGGGVDTSACAGYGEGTTISMQDSCFAGTAHFAPPGTTITVSNDGQLPHTLTAVDGSFDTGSVAAGETAELTFDEPGIYRVFCSLHGTAAGDGMAGVVVVGKPVPAAMAAPVDMAPFGDTVAAETASIREAMDNQGRAMGEIHSVQRDILASLDTLETSPEPAADTGSLQLVVLIMVGLAAGIALASLLTVLRFRMSAPEPRADRIQVPSESSVV